jgi:hypothetical protein
MNAPCAEKRVQNILQRTPARDLMRELESTLPGQCHPLGHIIGREVYRRVGSIESAFEECSPAACVAACLHGATGEALVSVPGVRASLTELRHPTFDLVRAEGNNLCTVRQACHAVGHVLFTLANDLSQALSLCDDISSEHGTTWDCYNGVFMEDGRGIFAQTENIKRKHTYRDNNDLLHPCTTMEERYQPACFLYLFTNQIPTLQEQGMDEAGQLQVRIDACRTLADTARVLCIRGVGWSLFLLHSLDDAMHVCDGMDAEDERVACVFGASNAYTQFGEPHASITRWCDAFVSVVAHACYFGVFDSLSYRRDPALEKACEGAAPVCAEALSNYLTHPEVPVPR